MSPLRTRAKYGLVAVTKGGPYATGASRTAPSRKSFSPSGPTLPHPDVLTAVEKYCPSPGAGVRDVRGGLGEREPDPAGHHAVGDGEGRPRGGGGVERPGTTSTSAEAKEARPDTNREGMGDLHVPGSAPARDRRRRRDTRRAPRPAGVAETPCPPSRARSPAVPDDRPSAAPLAAGAAARSSGVGDGAARSTAAPRPASHHAPNRLGRNASGVTPHRPRSPLAGDTHGWPVSLLRKTNQAGLKSAMMGR